MIRFCITSCLLICGLFLHGQSMINGQVWTPDETPLFAARVWWQSQPEQGQLTDMQGRFRLPRPAGPDTLHASFTGYAALRQPWTPGTDSLRLRMQLQERTLEAVAIQARKPISEQFSVRALKRLDIYLNPQAAGDPLRAITALPASTNADESANPSLRGSSAERSRVIYNGVPIYNPVRSSQLNGLGLFSIFNTELVETQYVYASNPPLTYGNSSGGLVEIVTPTQGYNNFQLSTSLASVGGFLTRKAGKQQKALVKVFGNWQFSDAFVTLNRASLPNLESFGVQDVGGYLYAPLGKHLSLKAFAYGIREDFRVNLYQFGYTGEASGDKIRQYNTLQLRYQKGVHLLSLASGLDQSRTRFAFGNTRSLSASRQTYLGLNYKQYTRDDLSWQAGLNYDGLGRDFADTTGLYWYAPGPDAPVEMIDTQLFRPLIEGHLYAKWDPLDRTHLSAGIRANVPVSDQAPFLSGQLAWRQDLGGAHSILLSAGRYHSYSVPGFFLRGNELLRADQAALDYSFRPDKGNYSAAAFIKRETGVQVDGFLFTRQAHITGIELFGEQDLGTYFQASLAYTRLWHNIGFEAGANDGLGRQDFPWFCKASFSARHPEWGTVALSWIGRSGRVFTPVVGGQFQDNLNVYQPQFPSVIHGERLPDYHNISLNMSRMQDIGERHSVILFLAINNLLNRENVRDFAYTPDYTERITEPFSLRTIYVGAVWNFIGK